MKKKFRRKSEKQTQDEKQKILEIFQPNEIELIRQLVSDLHKIRKIEPPKVRHFWQKKKAIKEQVAMIAEQQFYYVGDFIIENGWGVDYLKCTALWAYLQLEFK